MLARLQRAVVFVALLATAAGALHGWVSGHYGWMLGLALLLPAAYAGTLALEFALLAAHARLSRSSGVRGLGGIDGISNIADIHPLPTLLPLLRAWWGECRAAASLFGWQQPFRAQRWPDHLPRDAAGRRGVVLVHGYFCNRGVWNRWLRELQHSGTPFVAVSMEPVFGSIDDYAAAIEAAVQRLAAHTGRAPVAVAHSMGGLAVRNWWAKAAASDGGGRVERLHRLITLGTPHHGTWMARFAASANARQMRQGSRWLRQLHEAEPAEHRQRTTCYYSACDNIVFPTASATLVGADNRRLGDVAHVAMVNDPAPYAELQCQLAQP